MARSSSSRKWCLCISVVVAVVVLIIIIVPLAVVLPKRHHHKSSILIPLYIYPDSNATWHPLYEAVEAHPDLNFTVIINPSSGPGSSPISTTPYAQQVSQLNAYPNVNTVGYVRTGYATRNISDVLSEVATYAGWSQNLAMHGIFLDEAPHEYSVDAVEFMRTVDEAIKNTDGLEGGRTVIHNPGVIPDSRFEDSNADIIVVFEESYTTYQTKVNSLTALPSDREGYSIMVHSVPDMSTSDLKKFVDQLSNIAEFLFVTDNSNNYYESFGTDWTDFAGVVPT